MPVRIRSTRRRGPRTARRRFLVAGVLGALALAPFAVPASHPAYLTRPDGFDAPTVFSEERPVSNDSLDAPVDAHRAVFPYSVVPGGVNSVEELRRAIVTDAVVADHYRSFDLSKARVERLTAPRFAHVSYRVGERVYWTHRELVLPAGERVITDGNTIARTRCGNQVASQPGITSSSEPSAAVLDTPAVTAPLPSVPLLMIAQRPWSAASSSRATSGAGGSGGVASGSGGLSGAGTGGFVGGGGSVAAGAQSPETSSGQPCPTAATTCAGDVPPALGPGDGHGAPDNGFVPPPPAFAPPSYLPPGGNTPPNGIDPPAGPLDHGPHVEGTPPGEPFAPPTDTPFDPGSGPRPLNPEVPTPVPEPGSMMLMLTGAGGFLVRRFMAKRRGDRTERS